MTKITTYITSLFLFIFNASAEECVLSGSKVISHAKNNGFVFDIQKGDLKDGNCFFIEYSFTSVAAKNGEGIDCIVKLFNTKIPDNIEEDELSSISKKYLKNNWKIQSMHLGPSNYTYTIEPKWMTKNIEAIVNLSSAPKESNTLILSEITLNGDNCEKWKKAF